MKEWEHDWGMKTQVGNKEVGGKNENKSENEELEMIERNYFLED